MKVRISSEFKSAFKRLKKKYRSFQNDFENLLISLQENPNQGVEILDNVRKVRMTITSKKKGKSGGARVIVRLRIIDDEELQLIYIYDKSEMPNVSDSYVKDVLKRMN